MHCEPLNGRDKRESLVRRDLFESEVNVVSPVPEAQAFTFTRPIKVDAHERYSQLIFRISYQGMIVRPSKYDCAST